MALFGEQRDISLFRHINRELMRNIISQQVVYYKCNVTETKTNIYGEASTGRVFLEPVIMFALIERSDQSFPIEDQFGPAFSQPITFKFLRDDLVDASLVPQVGDFIMWQNGYWEIDSTNANQYFVGKNPDFPYKDSTGANPLENDLDQFGYNVSIICTTHYVPSDRVGINKERL
jgi:hypothetical protein